MVHRLHTAIPIEIDPETGFSWNGKGFSVSSTNIAVCMLIIHGKIIYFVWGWCWFDSYRVLPYP